jgi:hypothetical protein
VAVLERDLRLNLLGDATWSRLEPEVRAFIAQCEKTYWEHRDDHAFDFGPVILGLARALERQTNAVLTQRCGRVCQRTQGARTLTGGRGPARVPRLSIGELARVLGGERELASALQSVVDNARCFTGEFPVMLDAFAEVRNAVAYGERIDRKRATEWRGRILGVGSIGEGGRADEGAGKGIGDFHGDCQNSAIAWVLTAGRWDGVFR